MLTSKSAAVSPEAAADLTDLTNINEMIFETHAHYNSSQYDEDRQELLASMQENGVGTIVNVSAEKDSLAKVDELMHSYPFIYGAFGLHPDEVGDMTDELLEEIRRLSRQDKAVAIGEIGLDYYWDKENHDLQKKWFEAQAELAREEKLPIIIHSREAAADTLDLMKALMKRPGELTGVVHCFSYSKEMAREYLNMGYYIGVGGVVTFKNAKKLKEVVDYVPLTSILLETDCPYMAPVPNRGKRNNSIYIKYVAQEIARIKGVSADEVIAVTRANAENMYYKVKRS